MQTSDRFRMFRSLALAVMALLLVGGAVLGSQALTDAGQEDDSNQPGASADLNGDDRGQDASGSPEASESPEASAEETAGEDLNDDHVSGSPEASASESESEDESESPEASGSPDDHGGDSGHGGGDDSDAK